MIDNQYQIQEIKQKLEKQELSSYQKIYKNFIPEPYKKTLQQITKNCKLEQRNLKLEDETNFTKDKFKALNKKHEKDQMDKFEPVRVMVEKLQQKINKRVKDLNLLNDQQKPFVSDKTSEL